MFPLTWLEIPDFDLLTALNDGLLPGIYGKPHARRSLAAYLRDSLAHEDIGEALTRNTDAFMRFFEALRFSHGELLNYASIARDCGVSAKTVRTYFDILSGHASRVPSDRFTGARVARAYRRRRDSISSMSGSPGRSAAGDSPRLRERNSDGRSSTSF